MRELSKVEEFLSLGAAGHEPAGETTFSIIEGDLEVHGGRLHTNKTHLETNVGHGDMYGSVGFDQTLDLSGTWALPAASRTGAGTMGAAAAAVLSGGILAPALVGAASGELSVPFSVKGTLKDPKLVPGGVPGFKGGGANDPSAQQQKKKKGFLGGLFGKP